MNFKVKQYKTIKTKRLFKNYTIFFFKGNNWQFESLVLIKQKLKLLNFNCSKIFINTSQKLLNKSTFKLNQNLINGSFFIIFTIQTKLLKKNLINLLSLWFYDILALKVYNKMYSKTQFNQIFILNYNNYTLLLIKFFVSLLKNNKF